MLHFDQIHLLPSLGMDPLLVVTHLGAAIGGVIIGVRLATLRR